MGWVIVAQWLALCCLLLWGAWLCRKLNVPDGFAPLLGVAFAMTTLQLLGSVRLLWPGAQLLLVGGGVLLVHTPRRTLARTLCQPGVLAFLVGAAVWQVLFALRAPAFQTWDEFSHWGVFFKSIFYEHELAVWQAGRSLAHPAYPQGLPALYALFAPLLPAYAERDVFFVTDLPLLAAAGSAFAVAVPQTPGGRRWHTLCAVLAAPLLFWIFAQDTPYTTVYMDAPVGAMLAAGVALVTALPLAAEGAANGLRQGLAVGLVCAALTTVKEIGTVFALCVLGIWCLQCLLAGRRAWQPALAALLPTAGNALAWKLLLRLLGRNVDQFASMEAGSFFRSWAAARSGTDPYFYDIWQRFYGQMHTAPLLFHYNAVQLAIGCAVLSLLLAGGLFCLWRGPARRGARLAAVPLCMSLYWPCYMAVLFYVYICGMSPYEAERMASFERYAACYFIAWLAALLCAAWAIWCAPALTARGGRALAALQAAVLALASLAGGRAGLDPLVPPTPDWRLAQQQTAAAVRAALPDEAEGTLAVLSADSEAALQNMWYYQYELYPLPVALETVYDQNDPDLNLSYAAEAHDVRYVALFGLAPALAERYTVCADDGLAAAETATPAVYTLVPDDTLPEAVRLTLCRPSP